MKLALPTLRAEARITLGLISMLVALLLLLDAAFGIVPDNAKIELQARQRAAYSMALLFAQGADTGAIPRDAVQAMVGRDPQILAVALRSADGTLRTVAGDHRAHWTLAPGARSTLSNVRVPIVDGTRHWADLEVAFTPLVPSSPAAWLGIPAVRALLLLALLATVLTYLYLRRVLQHLDPGQVVPHRVRRAFDVLDEGVLMLDGVGRVMMVNEAFRRLAPTTHPLQIGRSVSQFEWLTAALGNGLENAPWKEAQRLLATTAGMELVLAGATSQAVEVVIKATPILDAQGRSRGSMVTFADVSSLHRLNRELTESMRALADSRDQLTQQNLDLHRLAERDPLTGCLNRRAFFDLAQRALQGAQATGDEYSCFMVDIDHFKQFNDRHGHAVGDQVIQAVAAVLMNSARATDLVCRYGGEEFCILVTLDTGSAMLLAQRLRRDIELQAAGQLATLPELRITASIGIAGLSAGDKRLEALIERADQAMYQSKRNGRNRVTAWTIEESAALVASDG